MNRKSHKFNSDTISKQIVFEETISGMIYRITPPCIFGRGAGVGLELSDPVVSRRHARIGETNGEIWLEDLDSTNGVFVNDRKITVRTPVQPGDSIQMGQTRFLVRNAEEKAAETTLVLRALSTKAALFLDHERLSAIYEITAELSAHRDLSILEQTIFARLRGLFHHDRGFIALFQEDGSLKPIFSDPPSKPAPLSKSIVNRLFRTGESFILEDALSEKSLKEQESVISLGIRSALCVPLIFHDKIYGLMYLDKEISGAYHDHDLAFLRSIANILAPLIENARLWSELKSHYTSTRKTLKKTAVRLIDMERTAAYVSFAQAMAHEIRDPLAVIGCYAKKLTESGFESADSEAFKAILASAERIDVVLNEVDALVNISPLQKKMQRIDLLIQKEIDHYSKDWANTSLHPHLFVRTPQVMIPIDSGQMRKALSMVFREIMFSIPGGSNISITVQDRGNELDIVMGETDASEGFCELFDEALKGKPWRFSLFLNSAYKIISDQGGKILLDPRAHSAFPLIIRFPKTLTM
jgi:signal transduction histidine kinase